MENRHINFLPDPNPCLGQEEKPRKKRLIWVIFIALSLIALAGLTKSCLNNPASNNPLAYDPTTLSPKKPDGIFQQISHFVFTKNYDLEGYDEDRVNILLLGIGGQGHDGPYLTDTIILASIKPGTRQIALISIPRDLGIEIPGYGRKKINNAAAFATKDGKNGPEFVAQLIADTFDIDIPYYIQLDFQAFSDIVNYVGGISVNVERSFTDHMYPAPNFEFQTVSFNNSVQTMNGATALAFVRSRHGNNGEGSDFARAKRQQKVLFAFKAKILSIGTLVNPVRINKIKNSLEQHLVTNLQFADIMALIRLSREISSPTFITAVLDDSPDGFLKNGYSQDGAYILEPKTSNFSDIEKFIKEIFNQGKVKINDTPEQQIPVSLRAEAVDIEIQNGTWSAGMAARMRKRLEDRGIIISTIGNSEARPQATSGIYNISNIEASNTLDNLQRELHLPVRQYLPVGVKTATTTDILILLGEDVTE